MVFVLFDGRYLFVHNDVDEGESEDGMRNMRNARSFRTLLTPSADATPRCPGAEGSEGIGMDGTAKSAIAEAVIQVLMQRRLMRSRRRQYVWSTGVDGTRRKASTGSSNSNLVQQYQRLLLVKKL